MNVDTLCYLANVCQRFWTAAEVVFRRRHKDVVLRSIKLVGNKYQQKEYTVSSLRRILLKFGHLIVSFWVFRPTKQCLRDYVEVNQHFNQPLPSIIDILTYCQLNLKRFQLSHSCLIDFESLTSVFEQELLLKLLLQLEELSLLFLSDKFTGIYKYLMPKIASYINHRDLLLGFLAMNQQLKCFSFDICIDDECIPAILQFTPNLEELDPNVFHKSSAPQTKDGFLKLAELKKLIYCPFAASLIKSFEIAKFAIEQLTLRGFIINLDDIRNICKFKMITALKLSYTVEIFEIDLISIVNELPFLTELTLSSKFNGQSIKLVKIGKCLRYIQLWDVCNFHIDDHIFINLVNVLKESRRDLYLYIFSFTKRNTTSYISDDLRDS